jgi:hypothetical protein
LLGKNARLTVDTTREIGLPMAKTSAWKVVQKREELFEISKTYLPAIAIDVTPEKYGE